VDERRQLLARLIDGYDRVFGTQIVRLFLNPFWKAAWARSSARPESDTADERDQAAFQEGFKKSRTIWVPNTRL
jgi:hypothetical protein